jgi:hypothetical protein
MQRFGMVVGIALLLAPAAAAAGRPTAACLDVQAEGLPAAVTKDLTRALRAALVADGKFARVEPKAGLMELRLLLDCQAATPACWVAVARTVQARTLFLAEVRRAGSGWVVRLQRIDGTSGASTDAVEAPLGRDRAGLARTLRERAADFFASLRGGIVRVLSEPTASEVLVDGEPRGTTPQSLKLRAGNHRIEVRRAGYRPFQQEVEVEAADAVDVDARLVEAPRESAPVEPPPAAPQGGLRAGAIVTFVAAGLALGAGAALAVLERQTQSEFNRLDLTTRAGVDRRFTLKHRGQALSVGADVAVAVGGAAAVLAIVLAARDLKARREAPAVRVTVGPGAVALRWTY